MERISVRVIAEAYDGQLRPMEVIVEGQHIAIKRILAAQPVKSRKDYSEDTGMRYVVRSDHRDYVLVYDQCWWVEMP